MAQYPYDNRRIESGGANAFKVFFILAFILFIIAIANPASADSSTAFTSDGTGRECGSATVGQPNETVASIAYRCNTTTSSILAMNPNLANANSPVGGVTVVLDDDPLPAVAQAQGQAVSNTVVQPEIVNVPPQVPVTGNATVSARAPFNYTVQPGDTLATLALTYGTSVEAIMAANPNIVSPNVIYAGYALWIP